MKKDGSTIISKVLEIGIFEVKYKDFSNLQGPTYGIAKSDVMRINYENGEEESFKSPRKGQPNFFFIKIGGGASSIVGRHADTDLKFACAEGVFYDIRLSSNFSIISGIEFVLKGCQLNDTDDTIVNMWYLQIPVLAALKFDTSDNAKFAMKVGPYVSYGLFGSKLYSYDVFDKDEGFRRVDLDVMAGISFEFEMWRIGLEYSRGLRKLDHNFKKYNQSLGLVFGLRL